MPMHGCDKCDEFVAAMRQHYAYLFDNYGFRLEHCEEGKQGEYCLVGLESAQARIKFELEQGTPVAYLGTLESPMQWGDEVDGVTVWYVVNALLNFVEQKSGPPVTPKTGVYRSTDDLLAAGAARLRPRVAELLAAFAPNRPDDWWQKFDAYQAERLRQLRQTSRPR